jgi:hypothetical protein
MSLVAEPNEVVIRNDLKGDHTHTYHRLNEGFSSNHAMSESPNIRSISTTAR